MHPYLRATLNFLNANIPHKDWFIAGGAAASDIFNDIDVYFTSRDAYDLAVPHFTFTYNTSNASSFDLELSFQRHTVQFIRRGFGDHISIVEGFDLNASRCVIFPDGRRYNHPSSRLPLHFTLQSMNRHTINRFSKYVADKGFACNPMMIQLFTSLLHADVIEVEDYYDNTTTKLRISPINQFRSYNRTSSLLSLIYSAIDDLPPHLRLKRSAYLFRCWSNDRPPIYDYLSTEILHAYHTAYRLPPHPRVLAENPEYLV